MGLLDKVISSIKYDEEDDYDEDYDLDEPEYDDTRGHSRRSVKSQTIDDDYDEPVKPSKAPAKGAPAKNGRNRMMSNGMEVCVIKPTSVEDAREITDTLLENRTVLLNMEGLDVDMAQRIIDFTSGSTYAIDGNLQKVSHYIFILTPRGVDVSGDFQEILSGAFDVPALNNKF